MFLFILGALEWQEKPKGQTAPQDASARVTRSLACSVAINPGDQEVYVY